VILRHPVPGGGISGGEGCHGLRLVKIQNYVNISK